MRKATILWIALVLFFTAAPALADYDELIKNIDRAWNERTGDTQGMQEAVKWAEQAYGEKPGFEAAWRAARACFWICDRTTNEATDLKWGKRGYEWGEKAITADPGRVEGHYFYAICLGEYGKGMSIVKALAKGLGGKYEKACEKAIAINPSYDEGGPERAYGRYWFKLPWPKYNAEKAEKHLLNAKKLAPQDARSFFYLAEIYQKEKKTDKLTAILDGLDAMNGTAGDEWETRYYKKMGKQIRESRGN
jgi:tetratricopeptide (TPR) repeat protein